MTVLPTRSRTERLLFQAIADLFEWIAVLLLALLNLLLLSQSAGLGPEPLLPAIALCSGMVLCHLLWQVLDRTPCSFQAHPMALWLLPLWGIIVLHALLSPAPWQAQYEATVATIALIAFWIGAHHLRKPSQIYTLLIAVAAPMALSIVFALLQSLGQMQDQLWILDLPNINIYRPEAASAASGIASGLFDSPRTFATLLALCLPVIAAYALPVRLPNAIRIGLLVLGWFALCALVLTQMRWTLLITAIALFVTPFVARSRNLPLKASLPLITGVLISALVAVSLLSAPTRSWIMAGMPATTDQAGLAAGGLSLFADNLLFGSGIGNFANAFESHRPLGFTSQLVDQQPLLIKLLAETGLLGTLAALGLAGWFFVRLYTNWRALPNAIKVKEEEIELEGKRYCQPLKTVTAGAVLMAASTAVALLLFGNPFAQAALVVLACSLLGLGTAQLPLPSYQVKPLRHGGYALTAAGLAMAILLPLLTLPTLLSRLYVQQTGKAIQRLQQLDQHDLLEAQTSLRLQKQKLDKAILLTPDNAPAWVNLSTIYLLQMRTATDSPHHIGELATEAATKILEENPLYLPAWLARAEAEQATSNIEAAESSLQKALECAPHNAYCWYRMADLLKQSSASRSKALEAINRSLELDPTNQLAQQVQRQLLIP